MNSYAIVVILAISLASVSSGQPTNETLHSRQSDTSSGTDPSSGSGGSSNSGGFSLETITGPITNFLQVIFGSLNLGNLIPGSGTRDGSPGHSGGGMVRLEIG
ncbi:hypothetical protein HDE_13459 [Halotydeus destructor]|nr:hypothetical protein HDE_13459 [Halotydeus destructor]